jgi:23S rRNA (cytosine1962-C5)-methyltransferase
VAHTGYSAAVDPARLWPDFDDAWILYEDDALLAVDKPAGIPSQAADAARPDDLVTRLRAHLTAAGRDAYLGVHQRLDMETSGVLVMTRRRDANASLGAQFEGRRVDKRYQAAVTGWKRAGETVLRDWIAPGDAGRMRVAREGQKGAELAVTRVRVKDRSADRALLDVRIETGKTHQIRVQLAHAGAPVAGDRLYGGPEAPRLMLHASELGLTHPITSKPLRIASPAPPELDAWVKAGDAGPRVYDDSDALFSTLARAVRRRYALGRSREGAEATTAFRLVNGAGDALPGLVVEVYADWLVAELEGDDAELHGHEARKKRVLDALDSLGFGGVYLKVRPKQASTLVDTRREDLAPKLPVRGTAAPFDVTILENGVPFGVRLGDGLQTGVFLDQRSNRLRVRDASKGKRVANLFAYTCAFSVAAARGGASETVSVDASVTALERGRQNFDLAGVPCGTAHTFAAEDVFSWVARTNKRGAVFDLVLLDPPSYSSTKKRRFVAKTDYKDLAADVMRIVAPQGVLLACVNHRGIGRERFRKHLYEAARAAGREVLQAKDLPTPSDFPPPLGGESHLKAVWMRLA